MSLVSTLNPDMLALAVPAQTRMIDRVKARQQSHNYGEEERVDLLGGALEDKIRRPDLNVDFVWCGSPGAHTHHFQRPRTMTVQIMTPTLREATTRCCLLRRSCSTRTQWACLSCRSHSHNILGALRSRLLSFLSGNLAEPPFTWNINSPFSWSSTRDYPGC
jgi:hypothetical protein